MAEMDRGWVNEGLEVITTIGDLESVVMSGGEEDIMVVREVTGCRGDLVEIKMIDEVLKIGEEGMLTDEGDTRVNEVTTTEKGEWIDLDRGGVEGTQEEMVEIKVLVLGGRTGEVLGTSKLELLSSIGNQVRRKEHSEENRVTLRIVLILWGNSFPVESTCFG